MPSGIYQHKKRQPISEEHKRKISKANSGRKLSEETKKKMSRAWKGKRMGDKNPSWKGGKKYYKERYKEYKKIFGRKRRVLKNNSFGSHVSGEWQTLKAQYDWTCPCCHRKEPEIKLTEDHIIPLTKGGSDNIENIQPLCGSCNCKKYTKIIKYNK